MPIAIRFFRMRRAPQQDQLRLADALAANGAIQHGERRAGDQHGGRIHGGRKRAQPACSPSIR